MERRRSWNTSFSPFQVHSAAARRADDIAALAKKCLHCRALTSLSHTPSFTRNFVTHIHIHTYIHTYVRACIHTYVHAYYLFTYFHTQSFTTSFVFPSFPVPATTSETQYWKKLTCGVIRSFNYVVFWFRGGVQEGNILEVFPQRWSHISPT